jgi:hypothetical protein
MQLGYYSLVTRHVYLVLYCHVGECREGNRRIAREEVYWEFLVVGSVLWAGGMRKMVKSMLEILLVTF